MKKLALAALLGLASVGQAFAASGGIYTLERQLFSGTGLTMSSNTVIMTAGIQSIAGTTSSTTVLGKLVLHLSGFFIEISTFVTGGEVIPPASIRVVNGVDIGVSTDVVTLNCHFVRVEYQHGGSGKIRCSKATGFPRCG